MNHQGELGASRFSIWLGLLAVYIAWGSTYLAIRFAVETIPPFLMAGTRFLIAGSVLFAWQRLAGAPAPSRREWRSAAIVGLLLLLGGNGLVSWAEQRVVSGVTALLVGAVPLWMALLDWIRPGGRRPHWQTGAGLVVGFLGISILIGPSQFLPGEHSINLPGAAALLMAGLFWAAGSLYSRNASLPSRPLLGTGMEMLAGSAGLFLTGTLLGEWGRLELGEVSAASLWGLFYLVVFGSLLGFAAYTWLLRVAPTPLVSTYAYVNPLIAILLGALIAQEPLTPQVLLSAAIIIGAVGLINLPRLPALRLRPQSSGCEDQSGC